MKMYLNRLLSNVTAVASSGSDRYGNNSAQYGVETFYATNKPQKKIAEPQNFVAPQFSRYAKGSSFSVAQEIVRNNNTATIIPQLESCGLSGCGGAAFPVVVKWKAALESPGPRYLIINGQEGEPDTFKDYMLMKKYPQTVVEGAVIAALALGVDEIIFAINSAYRECLANIEAAVDEALLALPELKRISFRVISGPEPDLYVCGEETALIEFLENRRGEPQLKPPFPFQSGYKGRPTVVQNVETVAWIPLMMKDPELFSGLAKPKLLQLDGAVNKPGIYEARIGTSLHDLMEMAGGKTGDSCMQAIEVGGMAGGLLPPNFMMLSLEHEVMARHGAMVGTGSVRFLDEDTNIVNVVLQAMAFFRNETCGRCTPCRVGTHELLRIADILTWRVLADDERKWLDDITRTMVNTSTCGLGKAAPGILVSLLRYWNVENGQAYLKKRDLTKSVSANDMLTIN